MLDFLADRLRVRDDAQTHKYIIWTVFIQDVVGRKFIFMD